MVPRRFMLITAGFLLTTFVVYQFMPVSSFLCLLFDADGKVAGHNEGALWKTALRRSFFQETLLIAYSGHPSPQSTSTAPKPCSRTQRPRSRTGKTQGHTRRKSSSSSTKSSPPPNPPNTPSPLSHNHAHRRPGPQAQKKSDT